MYYFVVLERNKHVFKAFVSNQAHITTSVAAAIVNIIIISSTNCNYYTFLHCSATSVVCQQLEMILNNL